MLVHLGGVMWSLMMWSALVGAPAGAVEVEEAEEVLVLGDNYARYMDTRWTFDVQVGMPWPVPLYAARNHMIQIVAFDVRMTIHCDGEAVRVRLRGCESCHARGVAILRSRRERRVVRCRMRQGLVVLAGQLR